MLLILDNIFPILDSHTVRKWLSKILAIEPAARKKRNFYLSYLVFQMQNLKISEPFDKDPPPTLEDPGKAFNVRIPSEKIFLPGESF
jgi:hypothetical protein